MLISCSTTVITTTAWSSLCRYTSVAERVSLCQLGLMLCCLTHTDLSFLCCVFQPMHVPHQSGSMHPGVMGGVGGECMGGGGGSTVPGGGVVGLGAAAGRGRPLNLKMKFVCGQCWREGQVNEPDKNLKYCTAKARHR